MVKKTLLSLEEEPNLSGNLPIAVGESISLQNPFVAPGCSRLVIPSSLALLVIPLLSVAVACYSVALP